MPAALRGVPERVGRTGRWTKGKTEDAIEQGRLRALAPADEARGRPRNRRMTAALPRRMGAHRPERERGRGRGDET